MPPSAPKKYGSVVVDSGFIIKKTGLSHLAPSGSRFIAPPEVLEEIRDSAAREHLANLPFEIEAMAPSNEAMVKVAAFARLTGDYRSLSVVDLKVLALAYEHEVAGCGDAHLREKPPEKKKKKRRRKKKKKGGDGQAICEGLKEHEPEAMDEDDGAGGEGLREIEADMIELVEEEEDDVVPEPALVGPKTWASLVHPQTAGSNPASMLAPAPAPVWATPRPINRGEGSGQFDDASESDDASDDETYANSDCDISDEECDIYVLDEEEVEERKKKGGSFVAPVVVREEMDVEEEVSEEQVTNEVTTFQAVTSNNSPSSQLKLDFPALGAAATVEYDGSDDEDTEVNDKTEEEEVSPLKPKAVTKDGRLFNSFRGYGDLVSSAPVVIKEATRPQVLVSPMKEKKDEEVGASRIIGGAINHTAQSAQVEDDGEGWLGTDEVSRGKAAFGLNSGAGSSSQASSDGSSGPNPSARCACATTDFAMQNVLLQLGLPLLSVDGVAITRTKSWVTRCSACFAVYGGGTGGTKVNTL